MFFFDKAKWNKVKEGQSPYFCNAVDSLMIPYKINFQKFLVNMDCMQNGHSYSYNYSELIGRMPHDNETITLTPLDDMTFLADVD